MMVMLMIVKRCMDGDVVDDGEDVWMVMLMIVKDVWMVLLVI